MMSRKLSLIFACLVLLAAGGWSYLNYVAAGTNMAEAADQFIETLDESERDAVVLPFDTPKRVNWHFIPKAERKGLQIKEMNEQQREAAHGLLRSSLSEIGYDKAVQIMQLEQILHELEKNRRNGPIRDPERYYFTLFGQPGEEGRWGLSVEGHHLSLNFVVEAGDVISSTPAFFGANPAIVKKEVPGGFEKGTRVLDDEEELAFELLDALDDQQRRTAIIAEEALREIRAAGESQPPTGPPAGLAFGEMNDEQQSTFKRLVGAYLENVPDQVRQERVAAIRQAGPENVHFAWAGATRPGVGHYYRIQGPTFLVEFVNTQPDPAGNPANHIHSVWRDTDGDFAIPIEQ